MRNSEQPAPNDPGELGGKPPQLVLASGSPRRRELMERFFGPGQVAICKPDFDENAFIGEWLPQSSVLTGNDSIGRQKQIDELLHLLPEGKMAALRSQYDLPAEYAAIAADTLVILDDAIFGKPADRQDAARMLRLLSGRTHEVRTGICLDARCLGELYQCSAIETTFVKFAELSEEQVQWYAGTGEPLDKAGAYGIQGYGAALVERIDGCYYNVMGLPVFRLLAMLRQAEDYFKLKSRSFHLLPWT
jgi:septum formation protein